MNAALFASKFRTLSQTKFVDFTASTQRIAYLTAEIAILSAVRCLISSGRLGDRRSTSDLARERVSSMTWSNVTYRPRRADIRRSEEHTSELQSRSDLVCRLLLEKKKSTQTGCSPSRASFWSRGDSSSMQSNTAST